MNENMGLASTRYLADIVKDNPRISYEEAVNTNDAIKGLAKEAVYRDFIKSDPPLQDATYQLLIAAQGPKAFTYLSPELTSALRVSNASRTKDPMRLTGVPTKKEISEAATNKDALDKLKWKLTGQGLKANAWYTNYGGQ